MALPTIWVKLKDMHRKTNTEISSCIWNFKSQVAANSRKVVDVGKVEGENGRYFTFDLQLNIDAWRKA